MDEPLSDTSGPRTLAIDIGGSHLKAGLLSAAGDLIGTEVRIPTPYPSVPQVILDTLEHAVRPLGPVERISAGFPGVVRAGVIVTAPNLGTADWRGLNLADRLATMLGAPARVENDATVQGYGVIAGHGLECVITLGTGMGFALFESGRALPHLELSQHPVRGKKTYDGYIGETERRRIGNKRWNRRVARIIGILRTVINFDTLLIGGGNGKHVSLDLPGDARIVPNEAGITGGLKLWGTSEGQGAAPPGPPPGAEPPDPQP